MLEEMVIPSDLESSFVEVAGSGPADVARSLYFPTLPASTASFVERVENRFKTSSRAQKLKAFASDPTLAPVIPAVLLLSEFGSDLPDRLNTLLHIFTLWLGEGGSNKFVDHGLVTYKGKKVRTRTSGAFQFTQGTYTAALAAGRRLYKEHSWLLPGINLARAASLPPNADYKFANWGEPKQDLSQWLAILGQVLFLRAAISRNWDTRMLMPTIRQTGTTPSKATPNALLVSSLRSMFSPTDRAYNMQMLYTLYHVNGLGAITQNPSTIAHVSRLTSDPELFVRLRRLPDLEHELARLLPPSLGSYLTQLSKYSSMTGDPETLARNIALLRKNGAPGSRPMPVGTGRITSTFNQMRRITLKDGRHLHRIHKGVDIFGLNRSPVFAAHAGVVSKVVRNHSDWGNAIEVTHTGSRPYTSWYAHLSRILVSKGQTVEAGSIIGLLGDTGAVTGPHLHYELKFGNDQLDPAAHGINVKRLVNS